ncbi:MAG: S-layer protein [Nanoarchaeota archaeon]|nr:S-layer protein [Nanoarchaeota archaeon]
MALLVNKDGGKVTSLSAKEVTLESLKHFNSSLSGRILSLLARKVDYPMAIARTLKVHEQRVYYHIRNLEKSGLIKVIRSEANQGVIRQYYGLVQDALFVKFKEFEVNHQLDLEPATEPFLEPFIVSGKLDADIIVGSPDPHGPDKARSRDGYYGMDLALFLGSFVHNVDRLHVKLDTEVRDLTGNMIVIGGPVVNAVTAKLAKSLPVYFDAKSSSIISKLSKKTYDADEIGVIEKIVNPFNPKSSILLVAGKRYAGTRAAIIAFTRYFSLVSVGNKHNKKVFAKIVEGVDKDSDGLVDDVEILE